jgi:hypothetical protein
MGQPYPGGKLVNCDDDVLGDKTHNHGDGNGDEVLGERQDRPPTKGKLLPFTGASIIAYLVVALELIAAGVLISRARKRA